MTDYYSDFDDAFTKQSDGDITKDVNVDAIFNSLSNIIMTTQGERRMLPTFACNVKHLLFEPVDEVTARLIAENIVDAIKIWDSRIDITSFDIEPIYDENLYKCRLNFMIYENGEPASVDFILTR